MKYPSVSASVGGFIFAATSIIAAALLFSVAVSTTPDSASQGTHWLFFMSLLVTMTAIFSCIWHLFRKFALQHFNANPKFWVSVRQSFLFSGLVCLSLFLHTLSLFEIWDAFPLLLAFLLLEFFFQAEKRPHASITYDPS